MNYVGRGTPGGAALLFPFISLFLFAATGMADNSDHNGQSGTFWSLGASVARVQGLGEDLGKLAGPDDGVVVLGYTLGDHATPYVSNTLHLSLNLLNNFSYVQAAVGKRWSTVPFPKTFLRPWFGFNLSANFLEDDRDLAAAENQEFDGFGLGAASSAGVTMRLSPSLALELAVKLDLIMAFGRLELGETFGDSFLVTGTYLRVLFLSGE